ncbi:hypothetical protein IC232_31220 [Microvirga sp. BT688]|uniref:hypothetical protein n=1 Tax=Microvirga sp. TaxID=1873136 RepID=UPI001683F980|nr:hypothetical protein [Microvirga sp.]MBD2751105.1 hypothetical protein [Microvirga sp.]
MRTRITPDRARATPVSSSDLLDDVPNFEAIYRIPLSHTLVAVRSRTHGGATTTVFWEHDEYDASRCLIACYKSFHLMTAAGEQSSGWQKFDREGQLLAENEILRQS